MAKERRAVPPDFDRHDSLAEGLWRIAEIGRVIRSTLNLAEVYAPFFRSARKGIRNEVGTGLGLAISKTLVELHGGEIKASSTVDVGIRMQVILPGANDAPTGQRTGYAPVD